MISYGFMVTDSKINDSKLKFIFFTKRNESLNLFLKLLTFEPVLKYL